jgi:hypothetical protein
LDEWRKSGQITSNDTGLIRSFIDERKASRHHSIARIDLVILTLMRWRIFVPLFQENSIFDIYAGIDALGDFLSQDDRRRLFKNT